MRPDSDYTPFFLWLGAGLTLALAAPIFLFVLWPWVGPCGMLVSFAAAFACIFRGMFVGQEITWGKRDGM